MSKLYFKEIPLEPSEFSLDVIVTKSHNKAAKFLKRRYNLRKFKTKSHQLLNSVRTVESGTASPLKGEIRIVMILETLNPAIIVHELVHVMHRMSRETGVELSFDAQEWHALAMERLYNETLKRSNYQIFNF